MAVTKIIKVRYNVPACIKYVTNEKKTDNQTLTSFHGCTIKNAAEYFKICGERNCRNSNMEGSIQAYHIIQSFAKDDPVTPAMAHEIGEKFMKETFGEKYAYTLATHIDKGHIHNHICMCAYDRTTAGKKLNDNLSLLHSIRNHSDRICREYGLSVIEKNRGKKKSYKEWLEDNVGASDKTKLRKLIDETVLNSSSYEDYIKKLKMSGIEIAFGNSKKYGTVTKYKFPHEKNFHRGYSLGTFYGDIAIKERIDRHLAFLAMQEERNAKKKEAYQLQNEAKKAARRAAYDALSPAEKKLDKAKLKISKMKDTSSLEGDLSKRGLAKWTNVQNAKRMQEINKNLLNDFGISYTDLSSAISSKKALKNGLSSDLSKQKDDLENLRRFVDACVIYKRYKIYETNMEKSGDKDAYYRKNDLKLDAFFDAKFLLQQRNVELDSITMQSLNSLKERLLLEEQQLEFMENELKNLDKDLKKMTDYQKEMDTYFKRSNDEI